MSTRARKDRKRAGIPFTKTPKVATPVLERSWFAGLIPEQIGGKATGKMVSRSATKVARALAARTPELVTA